MDKVEEVMDDGEKGFILNDLVMIPKLENASDNYAHVVGKIIGEYTVGYYKGEKYYMVMVKDLRDIGKSLVAMVLLPYSEESREMIEDKHILVVVGEYVVERRFEMTGEERDAKYSFILPEYVVDYGINEDKVLMRSEKDFASNYTKYNRVILAGIVDNEPTKKELRSGKVLSRFKLLYKLGGRDMRVNCTLWHVGDHEDVILERGDSLKLVGCIDVKNGYILGEDDNKFTAYNVIVQDLEEYDISEGKVKLDIAERDVEDS